MSFSFYLRNNLEKIPFSLGKYLSYIPFSYRPGIAASYRQADKEIRLFDKMNQVQKENYIFKKMQFIVNHAYNSIPFYKDFYTSKGFYPDDHLKSFKDIKKIPIIKKSDLLHVSIDDRSFKSKNTMIVNTGGSSGSTLSFYVPSIKMGIEWAHLQTIWKNQMGYKSSDLKILIVGRSAVTDKVEYDFLRNCLRIDLYSDYKDVFEKLRTKYKKCEIKFLRGYPSAIYELALFCKANSQCLHYITKHLKGVILVSEFPNAQQRNFIEDVFKVKTFAFYGHSEGCVIAYENETNNYVPMHSYGYCEVANCDGNESLIGTNFYNLASPLIRYNTEDLVENTKYDDNIVKSFSILQGRTGEVIIDKNNKKIPLTGLIFGRHHKLFDHCTHIQVQQKTKGSAQILYVPINNEIITPHTLFDTQNIAIDFEFIKISSPIKTKNGKLKLLV